MHIKIKSKDDKNINLTIPTALLCNNITASIAHKAIKDHVKQQEFVPSRQDVSKFLQMVKAMGKKYEGLEIVDIVSADGDIVKIVL